ncbi:MAG: DUF3164 family protein [Kiritimatiellae bacterium]|nr:DUF3164 family protein [Kiritimatiellia bacterium]
MAKHKVWIDGRGQVVPGMYVRAYDKARDRAVRRVLAGALKLRAQMESFMADAVKTMNGLAEMKESLGKRGNSSARSCDAMIEVTIRQQYNVRLDGRAQKARELMLDYAQRELERAGKGAFLLQQMIDAAFKPDRNGFLPRTEINRLLSYNVEDEQWNEGARLLREALTTEAGKRYLNIARRSSLQEDFKQVRLDIADCWPEEPTEVGRSDTAEEKGGDEDAV